MCGQIVFIGNKQTYSNMSLVTLTIFRIHQAFKPPQCEIFRQLINSGNYEFNLPLSLIDLHIIHITSNVVRKLQIPDLN